MKTVFAVIVTFKRPAMLRNCISSLLNQRGATLNKLHIVVNSDDSETVDVIKSFVHPAIRITYECFDNPGPAGGFRFGLERFLESDEDYTWLMDDDVITNEDCLIELMKCAEGSEYVFPRVMKGDGEEIVSFGWWGVLLSRSLVKKAGVPITDLFFWAEDTEYLQNRLMRVHGVKPLRCQNAVVNHLHQRQNKRPSWYYYYSVRNTLYYRTYIVGYNWHRIKRTLYLLPHSFFMILFKEEKKIKKIRLVLYGLYHGLIGKIGKTVDPKLNK